MKLIITLATFFLFIPSAFAQVNMEECVTFFTKGGPIQWIAGGVIAIVTLLSALTKWNIPSFIKEVAEALLKRGKN